MEFMYEAWISADHTQNGITMTDAQQLLYIFCNWNECRVWHRMTFRPFISQPNDEDDDDADTVSVNNFAENLRFNVADCFKQIIETISSIIENT